MINVYFYQTIYITILCLFPFKYNFDISFIICYRNYHIIILLDYSMRYIVQNTIYTCNYGKLW